VPWLLDVVFTLAGRVRPFNKYLPWELAEHPLDVPEWQAAYSCPRRSARSTATAASARRRRPTVP